MKTGLVLIALIGFLPQAAHAQLHDIASIAAGGGHSCAVTTAGALKCWGNNDAGQLGDNSQLERHGPVDVFGFAGGVRQVAAGWQHTCAITVAGGVMCWGDNTYGQLGDGTRTAQIVPAPVAGLDSGMVAVAAGAAHTCALTTAGAVKCWGANGSGELGDGTTTARLAPVDVVGLDHGVTSLALGWTHTCAVRAGQGAYCWGSNGFGRVGTGAPTGLIPAPVLVLPGATSVATGSLHTCAIVSTGSARCWGDGDYAQLGFEASRVTTPLRSLDLGSGFIGISAGDWHTCALTDLGAVKCWGDNSEGNLGGGSADPLTGLVDVVNLDGRVTSVAAGSGHACALAASGTVKCWGANLYGQLGDGTTYARSSPVFVVPDAVPLPILSSNYTDLWWNANEPGWGMNLDHQGNVLFATLYAYDKRSRPLWLFMSNGIQKSDGSFVGTLYQSAGSPYNASTWSPNAATAVGSMTIYFISASTAHVVYSVEEDRVFKVITRFVFSTPTNCSWTTLDRSSATNYQDLWWNPAEPGWGVNIAHEGNILFATLYTYDVDGSPLWLSMSTGQLTSNRTYSGKLFRSTGPAFNSSQWGPYQLSDVGVMTFAFTDGNNGTLTYTVNGTQVVKPIRRFVFATPVPQCAGAGS
jgi:alpha-tubulin suppressor-like RCC1 family protein